MRLSEEEQLFLYRQLVRARKMEEMILWANRRGKVCGFVHSGLGQEAIGVGGCAFMRDDDYLFPSHRGYAHPIVKGMTPESIFAEQYGKAAGCCRGKAGFHFADVNKKVFFCSGTIGGCFPVSAGLGITAKKNGKGQVVVCFFGDGASNRGTWHEAANLASLWKLPIVWIAENNCFAVSTHVSRSVCTADIAVRGSAYGMESAICDGNDVEAVAVHTLEMIERAREGEGPSLLECKTYRIRGHGEGDPQRYRTKEEVEEWKKSDPVRLYQERLIKQGTLNEKLIEEIDSTYAEEMKAAEKAADASEFPAPEEAYAGLYK